MAKRPVFLSAACLLCMAALPITANAQSRSRNQWERQVFQQLRAVTALLNLGYDTTSSYQPFVGNLRNNTYTDVTYTLTRGVEYALVGVCDDDCPDLDLKLYDENYNLIDSDTKPDATPVIEVTPRWTGVFHVRVIMSECRNNPCWYGVGEFEPSN
jgi:hypothetical protein